MHSTSYQGQVVWARVPSYPWWPATVTRNTKDKRIEKNGKVWVKFFNDSQGAYVQTESHLRPFNEDVTKECLVKPTHRSYNSIAEAVKQAEEVVAKQEDEDMDMDPDDVIALVRGKISKKRSRTSQDAKKAPEKPKASPRKRAKKGTDHEIVPAENEEDADGGPRRRSSRGTASLTRVAEAEPDEAKTDSSGGEDDRVEAEDGGETAKPPVKASRRGRPSTADADEGEKRIKALEKQISELKKELGQARKESKSQKGGPKRELVQIAALPQRSEPIKISIPEEKGTSPVSREDLLEELKLLKERNNEFNTQSEAVEDHRKVASEMASKFNARIRALNNVEAAVKKAEGEIADSLLKLLSWQIPFALLKESQAGKPVRKVEVRAGKRSPAIGDLAKAVVNQWMFTVRAGNESKKEEEKPAEDDKGDSVKEVERDGSNSPKGGGTNEQPASERKQEEPKAAVAEKDDGPMDIDQTINGGEKVDDADNSEDKVDEMKEDETSAAANEIEGKIMEAQKKEGNELDVVRRLVDESSRPVESSGANGSVKGAPTGNKSEGGKVNGGGEAVTKADNNDPAESNHDEELSRGTVPVKATS
mmetsp:Transcript_9774/g.29711  ORF Transcript_9774/g.29711 Transcript_9774/m.29711 type:complete len:592 (-) Transcript_9774:1208-2983(-)